MTGFGLESDTGEYGMYFDQKYEQRLAAQKEFEREVEIVLDNRVQHSGEDYEEHLVEFDDRFHSNFKKSFEH